MSHNNKEISNNYKIDGRKFLAIDFVILRSLNKVQNKHSFENRG